MATIKTRFGNINFQTTEDAAKVSVEETESEATPSNPLNSGTPLLARISGDEPTQGSDENKYKIRTTGTTLLEAIKVFVDTSDNANLSNGILLHNDKLVVNTNQLQIPLATQERIGGVKSSTATNFIKVHPNEGEHASEMEVNSLDITKLEQQNWLILDSEDADGIYTATAETK